MKQSSCFSTAINIACVHVYPVFQGTFMSSSCLQHHSKCAVLSVCNMIRRRHAYVGIAAFPQHTGRQGHLFGLLHSQTSVHQGMIHIIVVQE